MLIRQRRRGAVVVESAVVYPVFVLLLVGVVVAGLGVYRYQMTAALARETSRWTSVRGAYFAAETGASIPDEEEIRKKVIDSFAAGMDAGRLTIRVDWIDGVSGLSESWDDSPKTATTNDANGRSISNRVRVTVEYEWVPEVLLAGPIVFQSISETPMAF